MVDDGLSFILEIGVFCLTFVVYGCVSRVDCQQYSMPSNPPFLVPY